FFGKVFLSALFLVSAVEKMFNWSETEQILMTALCEWQSHLGFSQPMQSCLSFLVPWTPVLLIVAILSELLGGMMILLGYRERLGALLLILFLIPTTLIFHSFWFMEGSMRDLQATMFFKNLAILGGLIFVSIHGVHLKEGGSSHARSSMGL